MTNKQLTIFDFESKFKVGDKAKVRKPNPNDDPETYAVLDKYKNEKVIIVDYYYSTHYGEHSYLLASVKENYSFVLCESDLI